MIVEGITDTLDSPFERRAFEVVNAWQSGLSSDGRVTRLFAGTEDGHQLLILTRDVLMSGLTEVHREFELPPGSGAPRIVSFSNGLIAVSSVGGKHFEFDLELLLLRPTG